VSKTEFAARYGTWTFIFGALMWGAGLTVTNRNFNNLGYAITALVCGYEIARLGVSIIAVAALSAAMKVIGKRENATATTERREERRN
jgi:hypothetical protein